MNEELREILAEGNALFAKFSSGEVAEIERDYSQRVRCPPEESWQAWKQFDEEGARRICLSLFTEPDRWLERCAQVLKRNSLEKSTSELLGVCVRQSFLCGRAPIWWLKFRGRQLDSQMEILTEVRAEDSQ